MSVRKQLSNSRATENSLQHIAYTSISLDENYKEYAGVKEHGQVDITELE